MSQWHIREIPKGTYGELSKIKEELEEAYDSEERGQVLMLMFELSDIIGAAGGVGAKYGMSLDDLVKFSKLRSEIATGSADRTKMIQEAIRKKEAQHSGPLDEQRWENEFKNEGLTVLPSVIHIKEVSWHTRWKTAFIFWMKNLVS